MSEDYYGPSRHHHDRHYHNDRRSRDYRDRRRSRDRDSRDGHHDNHRQHRVPGLVSEPNYRRDDVDEAIARGQRESREYSKQSKTFNPPPYRPPVTVSQPYPTTFTENYTKTWRRSFYNASFLAFLPSVIGFSLLIAAIVLPEWTIDVVASGNTSGDNALRITSKGLFQVCQFTLNPSLNLEECLTLEEFAARGTVIDILVQATRGLVIIGAILTFIAMIVTLVFGLSRWERHRGALISGGGLAFAGACATAGMGCFSGLLAEETQGVSGASRTIAGTSFFLGWCGTGFVLVAAITAFCSHCARRQKKF